jgi:ankyrin repeat domain-containing protein 50
MKTTLKQVRKALDRLPEELDQTYEEAIERIHKQHKDRLKKDRLKLAMRLLMRVTHALRPLTVGEIQHALAVMDLEPEENDLDESGEDLPDTGLLITVCEGLVAIDPQSDLIRLIHYTTQDYFDRHREKVFPKAQIDISLTCIR